MPTAEKKTSQILGNMTQQAQEDQTNPTIVVFKEFNIELRVSKEHGENLSFFCKELNWSVSKRIYIFVFIYKRFILMESFFFVVLKIALINH